MNFFENLMFTFNAVLPVFLLVLIGIFLFKIKIIDERFSVQASNLVFKLALPVMLFRDISKTDFSEVFDFKMVVFCIGISLVLFLLVWGIFSRIIKDNKKLASFVHTAYRVNYAIIAIPVCINLFGEIAGVKGGVILSFTMPLVNILAVILLTFCVKKQDGIKIWPMIFSIITNPLIIGAVGGVVFSMCRIPLPKFIYNTINDIGSIAVPLALITIGGTFNIGKVKDTFKYSFGSALIKTVAAPIIFTPIAIWMGFRGVDLGMVYVYAASPAAVSSFIMSRAMGADAEIAGNAVVYSTFLSAFAIVIGITLLKMLGYM